MAIGPCENGKAWASLIKEIYYYKKTHNESAKLKFSIKKICFLQRPKAVKPHCQTEPKAVSDKNRIQKQAHLVQMAETPRAKASPVLGALKH